MTWGITKETAIDKWLEVTQWAKIRKKCNLGKVNCLPQRIKSTFFETWKKMPISNVCLGGSTITSKTKINIFLKFFLHSGSPLKTL